MCPFTADIVASFKRPLVCVFSAAANPCLQAAGACVGRKAALLGVACLAEGMFAQASIPGGRACAVQSTGWGPGRQHRPPAQGPWPLHFLVLLLPLPPPAPPAAPQIWWPRGWGQVGGAKVHTGVGESDRSGGREAVCCRCTNVQQRGRPAQCSRPVLVGRLSSW